MAGQRIAITGLGTFLAQRLVERLLSAGEAHRVLAIGGVAPLRRASGLDFRELDLTDPIADLRLEEILRKEQVDAFVHLAFRRFPSSDIEYDHELETLGTLRVMNACAAAGVPRLVIRSSTMVYGPRRDNPNFLTETHPLHGHRGAHNVQNLVEVEEAVAQFRVAHPEVDTTVLRTCWVMGPRYYDRAVAFFELERPPTVLGYDPLLQFVHEEDLVDVFEEASLASHPGVFNVVGKGVLPLSTLLALAGKRGRALPASLLYRGAWLRSETESGDPPGAFFDYLRYLWVADGAQAWEEFGDPTYTTREAWISFVGSRRMRRYA